MASPYKRPKTPTIVKHPLAPIVVKQGKPAPNKGG
jgi:hypothetical protein